jgi:UDP-N-acetylglucosamine 3-dehydrogenase
MAFKVGVVGSGSMGRNHVRVVLAMDPKNILVAFDPTPSEFESDRVSVTTSFDEFLRNDFDYVVVASPSSTHLEIAKALAERKIPTLVEKPLALDVKEALALEAAYMESNTFCAVGHVERFSPAFTLLKKKVQEGLIGEVGQISTRRVGPYSKRIMDVGVIFDLGSHDVDLVSWIMNSNVSTFSAIGTSFLGLENEDTLLVQGKLSSGQLFSHEINWLTPRKAREVVIIGSRGMLKASSITQRVTFLANQNVPHDWVAFREMNGDSSGEAVTYGLSVREPLMAEHDAFQLELSGTETEICKLHEGVQVVRQLVEYKREVERH